MHAHLRMSAQQSHAGDAIQPRLVPRLGFQAHLMRGVDMIDGGVLNVEIRYSYGS